MTKLYCGGCHAKINCEICNVSVQQKNGKPKSEIQKNSEKSRKATSNSSAHDVCRSPSLVFRSALPQINIFHLSYSALHCTKIGNQFRHWLNICWFACVFMATQCICAIFTIKASEKHSTFIEVTANVKAAENYSHKCEFHEIIVSVCGTNENSQIYPPRWVLAVCV